MSGRLDLDSIDRQVVIVEVSEMLEFVADFLAHAEGPLLSRLCSLYLRHLQPR